MPRIELALSEAYRVLKKGGRFLCMEFSKVENPLFSQLYGFYNFNVIPLMGQAIAGDKESYQYLVFKEIDVLYPNKTRLKVLKNSLIKKPLWL